MMVGWALRYCFCRTAWRCQRTAGDDKGLDVAEAEVEVEVEVEASIAPSVAEVEVGAVCCVLDVLEVIASPAVSRSSLSLFERSTTLFWISSEGRPLVQEFSGVAGAGSSGARG
jgi:hypothetical protein